MKQTRFLLLILLLSPLAIFAQTTLIGKVTDNSNFPLPGASVIIKGTATGTATDIDGGFTIEISNTPTTLVVSYIGFITKEVVVNNEKSITVVLEEDSEQLDEVVVVGYGSVNRKDLTGAVTSVKPDEEIASQTQSIENLLKGRAAGVQVTQNGTDPTAPVSIKIRGTGSLTSSTEPLYVIDGIIVNSATEGSADPLQGNSFLANQGGLTGIDPNDIESFEVLKDASATAIYGSRGANGVILITTKKGKIGKAQFKFNSSTSIGEVVRNIDVLDGLEYANYLNDRAVVEGNAQKFIINSDGSFAAVEDPDTILQPVDWADATYKSSVIEKYRISVSGGKEGSDYYVAAGYMKNKGVVPRAYSKSTDLSLNLNNQLTSKLKLGMKIAGTYTENSASKGTEILGSTNNSLVRQVISGAPILDYNEDNELDEDVIDDPTAWEVGYDDLSDEFRVLSSIKLDYKITDDLTYTLLTGMDKRQKERSLWYGSEIRRGAEVNGEAGLSTLNRFKYNVDNTLSYKKRFNKNHRINAVVGITYDELNTKSTTYRTTGFADESLRADGIHFGENITPLTLFKQGETYMSYLGRVNYTLKNKYIFTGTFRADGSSKFPEGKKWGYFPSFAAAWSIIDENFMENQKTFSNLKLRAGWGLTGNSNIPNYRYLNLFTSSGLVSNSGGGAEVGLVPAYLPNENITWETTEQFNAGLDYALFDNRITGSIDVYYKDSKDLLLSVEIPTSTGFANYFANQGGIENKGIELTIFADIISNDNFTWDVYGNFSLNRNEIKSLGIPEASWGTITGSAFTGTKVSNGTYFKVPANIFIQGQASGLFYGYETNGIVTTENVGDAPSTSYGAAQPGDVFFVDQNDDGAINGDDLTLIGDPNPDFTYGFGTSFTYNDVSLSLAFDGVYGNNIANANLIRETLTSGNNQNVRKEAYFDAYDEVTNPGGAMPRIGYDVNLGFTDRIVEDGSFLRLSAVVLGYKIPTSDNSFFNDASVFVSGQNLILWTDYSGYDPEVNSFAYDPGRVGLDWNAFPNKRTISLGVNLNF